MCHLDHMNVTLLHVDTRITMYILLHLDAAQLHKIVSVNVTCWTCHSCEAQVAGPNKDAK